MMWIYASLKVKWYTMGVICILDYKYVLLCTVHFIQIKQILCSIIHYHIVSKLKPNHDNWLRFLIRFDLEILKIIHTLAATLSYNYNSTGFLYSWYVRAGDKFGNTNSPVGTNCLISEQWQLHIVDLNDDFWYLEPVSGSYASTILHLHQR